MKKKSNYTLPVRHPGLINSSYTVFFIACAVFWAHVFSTYFPPVLQWRAFALSLLFALMVYAFRFIVLQFYEGTTVLKMIIAYYCLSAVMVFASAVRGVIAEGQVPVIHMYFFGANVYSYSGPSVLVASVVPFYGAVTLAMALLTAELAEFLYNHIRRLIPRIVRIGLAKADRNVDTASVRTADSMYILSDWKGMVAALGLLAGYGVLYMALLIF